MSLFADISTLSSALSSFTYGESIASENTANALTVGYTTQTADLASLPDFAGVNVATVQSARNSFLYNQIYGQLGLQGYTNAQLSGLQQLANIFPEIASASATNGLSASMSTLSAAWSSLAAAAQSGNAAAVTAAQGNVLSDMQSLAHLFNTDANQLYNLQQNVDQQVINAISQVNTLEDQILTLNKQIVDLGGQQSAQTSTLIDQREVAAEALVGLTGANVAYNTDGAMVVTFSGGTLVDGIQSYHLGTLPSATSLALTDVGYVSVPQSSSMADVTPDFTSGTLGGLLSVRDNQIAQSILTINKMANGIINFANTVNEGFTVGGYGSGGASNIPLFTGTKATDIEVNPTVVQNPNEIGATRDVNTPGTLGDLATLQASMTTFNMWSDIETFAAPVAGVEAGIEKVPGNAINPDATLQSQATLFANPAPSPACTAGNPGLLMISTGSGPAVQVSWNTSMTLNQIIAQINASSGGAFYATLVTTNTGQFVHIFSNAPLSIWDVPGGNGANLGAVLHLSGVLNSSAPLNSYPITAAPTGATLDETMPLNEPPVAGNPSLPSNQINLATQPVVPVGGGTMEVDGNTNPATVVQWNASQSIDTILANIESAAPAGTVVATDFFPSTQTVELINAGPPFNGATLSAANPMKSVSVGDLTGNLSQVLNLNPDSNATQIFSELTTNISGSIASSTAEQTQADNLVKATQALQTAQSGVNTDAQMAQAVAYQNAYEAAVRMQYVLFDMLNFLITETGSPNPTAPTGS